MAMARACEPIVGRISTNLALHARPYGVVDGAGTASAVAQQTLVVVDARALVTADHVTAQVTDPAVVVVLGQVVGT